MRTFRALVVAGVVVCLGLVVSYAITVNPASSVTADSAATGLTIPYRDANGDFAVNALTAATINVSSEVDLTGATVSISSSATSNFPMRFRGAYTSTQLSTLSASPGDVAFNITITQLVLSSATTEALAGAWVMPSTSTAYTKLAGY